MSPPTITDGGSSAVLAPLLLAEPHVADAPFKSTKEAQQIIDGLVRRREIDSSYLYDARGSELFEQITGTDAYYLTRQEYALLEQHADSIVRFACDEGTDSLAVPNDAVRHPFSIYFDLIHAIGGPAGARQRIVAQDCCPSQGDGARVRP